MRIRMRMKTLLNWVPRQVCSLFPYGISVRDFSSSLSITVHCTFTQPHSVPIHISDTTTTFRKTRRFGLRLRPAWLDAHAIRQRAGFQLLSLPLFRLFFVPSGSRDLRGCLPCSFSLHLLCLATSLSPPTFPLTIFILPLSLLPLHFFLRADLFHRLDSACHLFHVPPACHALCPW